jgi:hypothetical protein
MRCELSTRSSDWGKELQVSGKESRLNLKGRHLGFMAKPRRTHSSKPPSRAATFLYPRLMRIRAKLALVASLAQEQ